jgi:hypothetical protein
MSNHGHQSMGDVMDQPWSWKNRPGYKPVLLLIAAVVFSTVVIMPPTPGMVEMVNRLNPAGYKLPAGCETIIDAVNQKLRPEAFHPVSGGVSLGDGVASFRSDRHLGGGHALPVCHPAGQ